MYDVNDYGRMMADPVRMHAYAEALRRAVKPGSVVVDVGTGTGIFALLAARFGARKVYAIDTNPCIHLAHEVAKANGLADKIEFIHKDVREVEPPEKADVLVADCRGHFPLFGPNLEIVSHARRSWLTDGGTMIAEKDEIFVALVHDPYLRRELEAPWHLFGFDWEPCRAHGFTSGIVSRDAHLDLGACLTRTALWSTLDYASVTAADVHGSVRTTARQSGRAHAVALWFVTTTAPGIQAAECKSYRPLLLPLEPPVVVEEGEAVEIRIDALRARNGYVYAWSVKTPSTTRVCVADGLVNPAQFRPQKRP
jgi:protein arginine N-methyltransferase 1